MILLEAQGLSKSFKTSRWPFFASPAVAAVTNLSLDLKAGEVLGIVGESGCGKSTLVRILMGMIPADSGVVTLLGKPLPDVSRLEKAQAMQMIFQDPSSSLHPRLLVSEAINEVMRYGRGFSPKEAAEEILHLLTHLGLPQDVLDRYPHQLSGGQKQRVSLLRALAMKPSILICDEPLTALDRITQSRVLALLQKLRHELGLAMIFISHDLTTVRALADRVAVMYAGQWVESGPTGTVLAHPQHPYTRYLLQSLPKLYRQEVERIPDFLEVEQPSSSACPLAHRCPYVKVDCHQQSLFLKTLAVDSGEHFSQCIRRDLFPK